MPADSAVPRAATRGDGKVAVLAVPRTSLADAVHDQLRAAIVSGRQPPGSVLPPETELAAQAGVNRQAVREALQRLRQVGLIEIVQGGGAHVQDWRTRGTLSLLADTIFTDEGSIDPRVVESIFRLRLVTLVDASRLAALRHAPAIDERLAGLVVTMRDQPDHQLAARGAFWDVVTMASGNVAYQLVNNTQAAIARKLPDDVLLGLLQGPEIVEIYHALAAAISGADENAAAAAASTILGPSVAYFAAMQ